ncbi:hypothetical protein [Cellulomonas sp.]|uniref:hypothetical protein n=1 Tax=Cellulomonas sp. TaxID=40001 RepID=UPI003BA92DDE
MRPRVLARVAVGAVLGALALGLSAAPAQAADELLLSTDGTSWSTALTSVLFGGSRTLVPGDVVTSTLWVRNASGDRARVEVDVADALGAMPGTFAGDLALTIDGAAAPGGARWRGPVLEPGAAVRIPLVVTFDVASEASSRLEAASVLDAVVLVQTAVGPGPSPAPTASGSPATVPATVSAGAPAAVPVGLPAGLRPPAVGGLALTGQELLLPLGAAAAAVVAGLLLVAVRRRSRGAQD